MPRGRRRKIEVPTDTQPQFELGDREGGERLENRDDRGDRRNRGDTG